ncbi:MAG: hypothetical protein QXN55_00625 [Candidatus Nitrosotenuis sp.]
MNYEEIGKIILGVLLIGIAFKLVMVLIPWALKFLYYGLIGVAVITVGKMLKDKGVF